MGRACTHRRAEIGIQEGTGTSATWWPSWWSPSSSLSGQRASGQAAPSRPSICAPPLLPLRRRTFTIRMVLPPFPRRKTGWRTIRGSVPSVLCYVERRRREVGGNEVEFHSRSSLVSRALLFSISWKFSKRGRGLVLSQYSTGVSIFFCFLLPVLASSLQLFRFLPSCFDFVLFFLGGKREESWTNAGWISIGRWEIG